MNGNAVESITVSARLQSAIAELQPLQELLLSAEVDPRVLTDFRDALNRVRNTAWAAQQSIASTMFHQGPRRVASFLTSERIRAAYQLCCSLRQDLTRDDLEFQKGQLSELYSAATTLLEKLKEKLGSDRPC